MANQPKSDVDEAQIVGNYKADHLYTREWSSGEGRYLNFVIDEHGWPQAIDIELEPHARNRIKVTISFVHDRSDITKIELKKFKLYKRKGWQPCPDDRGFGHQHITLRPYSFEKLLAFLQFVSGLDIPGITQRRLALSIDGSQPLDDDTKRKLRTLLARKGGTELIAELLKTGLIATEDLVNLGYRKQQLALFEALLADPANVIAYQKEHGLREDQPESAWQHFFEHNEWIFGYGLDYRFQGILQSQFHASDTDADGSQAVISDFLLGDKRFTTFVEINTSRRKTQQHKNTMNATPAFRRTSDLLCADWPAPDGALSAARACGAVPFSLDSTVIRSLSPSPPPESLPTSAHTARNSMSRIICEMRMLKQHIR